MFQQCWTSLTAIFNSRQQFPKYCIEKFVSGIGIGPKNEYTNYPFKRGIA